MLSISAKSADAEISSTEIFLPSNSAVTVPPLRFISASKVLSPELSTLISCTFHKSSARFFIKACAPSILISSIAPAPLLYKFKSLKVIFALSTFAISSFCLSKSSTLFRINALSSSEEIFHSSSEALPIFTGVPIVSVAISSTRLSASRRIASRFANK